MQGRGRDAVCSDIDDNAKATEKQRASSLGRQAHAKITSGVQLSGVNRRGASGILTVEYMPRGMRINNDKWDSFNKAKLSMSSIHYEIAAAGDIFWFYYNEKQGMGLIGGATELVFSLSSMRDQNHGSIDQVSAIYVNNKRRILTFA